MADTIIYYPILPKTSINTERELPFMTPNNHTAPPKKSYMNSQKPQKKNIIFADNYIFHYWTEFINNPVIQCPLLEDGKVTRLFMAYDCIGEVCFC